MHTGIAINSYSSKVALYTLFIPYLQFLSFAVFVFIEMLLTCDHVTYFHVQIYG